MTQTFRSRDEQVADLTNCLTKDCSGFHRSTIEYTASSFVDEARALGAAEGRGKGVGYLFHNPDTGTEYLPYHPVESGECPDAENIRQATGAELLSELQSAWKSWAEDRSEKETVSANVAALEARIAELEEERDGYRSTIDELLQAIGAPFPLDAHLDPTVPDPIDYAREVARSQKALVSRALELRDALQFHDRVKAASVSEKIAVGQDAYSRLDAAMRSVVAALKREGGV